MMLLLSVAGQPGWTRKRESRWAPAAQTSARRRRRRRWGAAGGGGTEVGGAGELVGRRVHLPQEVGGALGRWRWSPRPRRRRPPRGGAPGRSSSRWTWAATQPLAGPAGPASCRGGWPPTAPRRAQAAVAAAGDRDDGEPVAGRVDPAQVSRARAGHPDGATGDQVSRPAGIVSTTQPAAGSIWLRCRPGRWV